MATAAPTTTIGGLGAATSPCAGLGPACETVGGSGVWPTGSSATHGDPLFAASSLSLSKVGGSVTATLLDSDVNAGGPEDEGADAAFQRRALIQRAPSERTRHGDVLAGLELFEANVSKEHTAARACSEQQPGHTCEDRSH